MSNTLSEVHTKPNKQTKAGQPIGTQRGSHMGTAKHQSGFDAFADRLRHFYETLNINIAEFERRCNLSNGQGAKVMNGKMGITLEKLRGVFEAYPELSPSWLIAGTGNMFYSPEQQQGFTMPKGADPFILMEEALEAAIIDRYHLQKCRTLLRAIESAQREAQHELLTLHKEYMALTKVVMGKQQNS